MNTYIPLIPICLAFLIAIFMAIWNGRQMSDRIKWLQNLVTKRDEDINALHDRLMAKSLNEYKMWKQSPDIVPPIEEPKEPDTIDFSRVGRVSGEEEVIAES